MNEDHGDDDKPKSPDTADDPPPPPTDWDNVKSGVPDEKRRKAGNKD